MDECKAMKDEFDEEFWKAQMAHEDCQAANHVAEVGDGARGTSIREFCAFPVCQSSHGAMAKAWNRGLEQWDLCVRRLDAYQVRQRRLARERKDNEERASQREQEETREKAEREAERKASHDREAEEIRRSYEELRRDLDRQRADFARESDERAKEREARTREREERERAERARQVAAERERQEQSERAAHSAEFQPRADPRHEEDAALSAAKQERDSRDQSLYLSLVAQLKETKDTLSTVIDFARNPFAKTLEMASDRLNESLLGAAIDTHAHIGPEKSDPRYDAIAAATDEARSFALGGNPFAEKISGLAMSGVQKIHRETLGQLDAVAGQIGNFGSESAAVSSAPAPLRPSPPSRASDGGNPFARSATTTANDTDVSSPTVSGAGAPSTVGRPVDAATISHYEVPAGHTFYRAPGSTDLVIVQENQARPVAEDDRYVNGVLRCSRDGRGRVIAKCEERRRTANPFARKASQ